MASHDGVKTVTLVASAAITNGQVLEVTGARTVAPTGATTDIVIGIAAETVASGSDVPVALLQGIVEVRAGGAITVGEICVPDASGDVTGVASIAAIPVDSMGIGIALNTAADTEILEMLAQPIAGPHTA